MEGDLRVYGIAILSFFSSVISVIWILMCGTAVSFSPAVCGFSSFWLTVFGKEDPSRFCGIGYPPPPPAKVPLFMVTPFIIINRNRTEWSSIHNGNLLLSF